jgi:hypothetical protein
LPQRNAPNGIHRPCPAFTVIDFGNHAHPRQKSDLASSLEDQSAEGQPQMISLCVKQCDQRKKRYQKSNATLINVIQSL